MNQKEENERVRGVFLEPYIYFLFRKIVKMSTEELGLTGDILLKNKHRGIYNDLFRKDWRLLKGKDARSYDILYNYCLKEFDYQDWGDFLQKEKLRYIEWGKPQEEKWNELLIVVLGELKNYYEQKNNLQSVEEKAELSITLFKNVELNEMLNKFSQAIQYLEKCIILNPNNYSFAFKWAELNLRVDHVQESIAKFDEIAPKIRSLKHRLLLEHNVALSFRALAYRIGGTRGKELIIAAYTKLEYVFKQIDTHPDIQDIDLLVKVGVNTCLILLDMKDRRSATEKFYYIFEKSSGYVFKNKSIELRLNYLEGLLHEDDIQAKEIFMQLMEKLDSVHNIEGANEMKAEVANSLIVLCENTHEKISILKSCFTGMLFGDNYSDIEYKTMLTLGEILFQEKQFAEAKEYILKVLQWSNLNEDIRNHIESKIMPIIKINI